MPDYKKKKHSRFSFSGPRPKKEDKHSVKEKESNEKKPLYQKRKNMRVVKGKQIQRKRKLRIFGGFVAVVVVFIIVLEMALPAGIFESIKIHTALMGSGSYPVALKSTESLNTITKGSYYYLLTNTHVSAYSNSGKEVLNFEHGFENPVLKTSASRSLVYDQGGKSFYVFDIDSLIHTITTEGEILAAAVSNRGNFAVATTNKKYTASVTVFDDEANNIYEWYSAKDTINAIGLSSSGDKLAVATLNVADSKFKSTLSVFEFDSATAEYTESFDNTLIRTIDTSFSSYFTVATDKKIKSYKWRNFKNESFENDYDLMMFDSTDDGYIAVFSRENNRSDNRVVVLDKSGEVKYRFNYKGTISDISADGKKVYILSETELLRLDDEGKIIMKSACGFGGKNIFIISSDTVAVITDSEIQRIKF